MSSGQATSGGRGPSRRAFLALAGGALAACATGGGTASRSSRALRVPARARLDAHGRISPLSYSGGFDVKAAVYETLVRMGPDGRLAPGLARAWSVEDAGLTHVLELREGASFHDGTPADAQAVRLHMRRWVGLPEHGWIESSDRITAVEALSPTRLRIRSDRACDLLSDLLAINPCAVTAPGAFDRQGVFEKPVGSGPFRFVELLEQGRIVRCEPFRAGPAAGAGLDFHIYDGTETRGPIDDLLAGRLDALVDTWGTSVPRERVQQLRDDARFRISVAAGGSLTCLTFRLDAGPTADASVRRRIRAALDREALVREIELGFARACATWAPPTVVDWPAAAAPGASVHRGALATLRLLRAAEPQPDAGADRRLHELLAQQLRRAGIEVEIVGASPEDFSARVQAGDFDLVVLRTHGVPYDPSHSMTCFLPAPARPSASTQRRITGDPVFSALVREAKDCASAQARQQAYRRIQAHIDREAVVVPLYSPQRLAVVRKEFGDPVLDHDMYHVDWGSILGLPGQV